uniref:ATP-binding cassette domain-containing protein n=1 Tax=Desertihabitans aurantiacus TaxID=2282477 RepID=UPI0013005850
IAEGAAAAAGVAALLVGAFEVREGRASAGTVLAAVSLAGLLGGYLRDLGRVAEYAAGARIARRAVRSFLDIPPLPDPADQPDLEVRTGAVEIERVSVGEALSDVTLRVRGGRRVAVVGANGAGKSTLVALVARLSDPDAGRVCIDGQDVRHRSLASVRAAVGIASPDLPLLRGSLRRNVTYRNPRVDEAELARISTLCGLDELAAELPDGWRTDVGESGSRLSAGQRGRVAVARAALGRPPLLVLDEAESHLDADASRVVDRVLADHSGTALVVTHRRELVERADEVWCLQDGRVVETGPPGLLLTGTGPTARLFAAGPRPVAALAGRS